MIFQFGSVESRLKIKQNQLDKVREISVFVTVVRIQLI